MTDTLGVILRSSAWIRRIAWLRLFDEHGVPAGEIMSLICAVEHPELGEIRLPGPPIQLGRSTSRGIRPRRCSMSLARRSGNG